VGAVYGLDNSINAAGRAIAPLLGAMVANQFGLRATFVVTGLIFFVSALVAIWRLPKIGQPSLAISGKPL
jgi:DHA1 family multidrug resistance protein-like MFS transporter